MSTEPEVLVFPTLEELQAATAERIVAAAEGAVAERGRFLMAISGGSAPPGVFLHLTRAPLFGRMPWAATSIVWVDERYVPYSDPESNYSQARRSLLDHAPIPSDQVYPVATYFEDPAEAAALYGRLLAALLDTHAGRIDLALLGMGPDGHTASLFPDHPGLDAPAEALAIAVEGSPKPPPRRISLTPAALNRSAEAIFLVAGADKALKVRAALRGPFDPRATPAQLIRPAQGRVVWMLDAAAAQEL